MLFETAGFVVVGLALSGIGFDGGMTTTFKAFAAGVSKENLQITCSMQYLSGGIGGIVATKPVAVAIELIDWLLVSLLLLAFTVVVGLPIGFVAPEKEMPQERDDRESFFVQLKKKGCFFLDGLFRYIALVAEAPGVIFCSLYVWIGPWLHDVARLSDTQSGV